MKAFPVVDSERVWDEGMDLRDYFAAKAMQYWLSNPIDNRQIEKLCEGAYQIADAMMKAREKK